MLHNETNRTIVQRSMTLSADSIRLTREEKEEHEMTVVPYSSPPALKIGKLAVNKVSVILLNGQVMVLLCWSLDAAFAFDMNNVVSLVATFNNGRC